ncbi:hypothetical protein PInf_022847 [Phytophthora infestans]|nr:hypothetical protein PInf_022847 [Phytophthora infestans]
MAAAANFLQRPIFVLAYNTDGKHLWYCSKYRPSLVSRGRKIYDTGQQIPLQVKRCLAEVRKAKRKDKTPPLVVRFWGNHYSAFVHTRQKAVKEAEAAEESRETAQMSTATAMAADSSSSADQG